MKWTIAMQAALLLALLVSVDAAKAQPPIRAESGTQRPIDEASGVYQVQFEQAPAGRELSLSSDAAQVVRAYVADDPLRTTLPWAVAVSGRDSKALTHIRVDLPRSFSDREPARRVVIIETIKTSGQLPDGRILLGTDRVQRAKTRAETQAASGPRVTELRPGWIDPQEVLTWSQTATRPGRYTAELTYALAGTLHQDNEIELSIAGQTLSGTIQPTGAHAASATCTSIALGEVAIAAPGELVVSLKCTHRNHPASILDALAITLRPACEGRPIAQAADGSVTCHARDVTIHGVQVQYEPKPEKNTVGYWTNSRDRVAWEFTLQTPGRFEVEILQGCGKDAGGSDVELSVDDQPLRFVVEDTGHFQNFVARKIGSVELDKPGRHTLRVKPLSKAGVAVMDLRQVRLVPVP